MQTYLDENTRSARKPWRWTRNHEARAKDVMSVLDEFKDYLPMTLRQIYYQVLHYTHQAHWMRKYKGGYGPVNIYDALGPLMKWMRIEGRISKDVIIDEHRILTVKMGYSDPFSFVDQQIERFGRGYNRCNAQKQKRHIEVWLEKAALLRLVEPVADEFCRRVVACKGYNSITFQTDFYNRAIEAMQMGMVPTVLYFGDWDPSGENMLNAAMQTINDELGLEGVEYYRQGINPEHFQIIQKNPVPIKPKDPRAKQFIKKYGSTAYELDAFHPEQLKRLVRGSIVEFTDMSAYQDNIEREKYEAIRVDEWVEDVKTYAWDQAAEML